MSKIPFVKLTTYDDKSYYLTQKQADALSESLQDPEMSNNLVNIANDKIRLSSVKSLEQVFLQLADIPKYLVERIQKDYPKTLLDGEKKKENVQTEWRRYWADDPRCEPYRGQPIMRKHLDETELEPRASYEPADSSIDKLHLPYVCRKVEVSKTYVTDPKTGKQIEAKAYGRILEEIRIDFDYTMNNWYRVVKESIKYTS